MSCPSYASRFTLSEGKGAGKTGRRLAPTHPPCEDDAHAMHRGNTGQPNVRPSLRSGLTAYAVLSREPSSFWPPSPSRNSRSPRRLTRVRPSQRLDRSNDGQDHTVSPYAGHPASPRGFAGFQRRSSCTVRGAITRFISPCTPDPASTPPASTATQPAFVTTYDRPFGGLGWPTNTINQNFGKVEYF
jgi:hypothetical protein